MRCTGSQINPHSTGPTANLRVHRTPIHRKYAPQLKLQLSDRNVHISLDEDAKTWLTARGYDKLYGARPMGRLIQEKIKQPLAEELLFGKLVHGGEVVVTLKDDALSFELTPAPPKRPKKKGGATPKVKV